MRRSRFNLHASAAHRHNLGHQGVAPGTEVPVTRTLTCLVAAALAGAGSTTAQSGLGLKGGFSYGNVSNRGLVAGHSSRPTYR